MARVYERLGDRDAVTAAEIQNPGADRYGGGNGESLRDTNGTPTIRRVPVGDEIVPAHRKYVARSSCFKKVFYRSYNPRMKMHSTSAFRTLLWILALSAAPASAQTVDQLTPHKVKLESVDYLGKRAIKITEDGQVANGEAYAVVKDIVFHNGSIDVELAGRPAGGATEGARGFIGIGFRLQNGRFEYIYLRPTNGRADDQVRRKHSTQYSMHPDFSFAVSRQQAPEKYESYVDLEAGAWTHYRITVEGTKARLYVHGAAQPCLIVNDLKLGDSSGGVALWIGPGSEGYFTGLDVKSGK